MNRYSALRARSRILSYYDRSSYEFHSKNEIDPFDRAKAEWLKHAKNAILEVEEMTLVKFNSTREYQKSRKPNECEYCGRDSTEMALVVSAAPTPEVPA